MLNWIKTLLAKPESPTTLAGILADALRAEGMTLLAMAPSEQEGHVKRISDTLADAFMSKTQAIPQAQIDAKAQRLGNLEDGRIKVASD
eukprot:gene32870-37125_t